MALRAIIMHQWSIMLNAQCNDVNLNITMLMDMCMTLFPYASIASYTYLCIGSILSIIILYYYIILSLNV